jgi:inorganic pyrophosphatase
VDCVYGREEALKVIEAARKDYHNHYGNLFADQAQMDMAS